MTTAIMSKTKSQKDYKPPEWSQTPKENLELTIIKNGTEIGKLAINDKPFYSIGRESESVDICLLHPSISRRHCVIQHNKNNSIYIFDQNSQNKTFINKKAIEPNQYIKLNVGDHLRFGSSSRSYVVEGPMHLMPPESKSENNVSRKRKGPSLNLKAIYGMKQNLNSCQEIIKSKVGMVASNSSCNWGINEKEGDCSLNENDVINKSAKQQTTPKPTAPIPTPYLEDKETADLKNLRRNLEIYEDRDLPDLPIRKICYTKEKETKNTTENQKDLEVENTNLKIQLSSLKSNSLNVPKRYTNELDQFLQDVKTTAKKRREEFIISKLANNSEMMKLSSEANKK